MPIITRERTRPGLRLVEVDDLGAIVVLMQPRDPARRATVVVDQQTPAREIRNVARALLPAGECRQLAAFLDLRRRR